jgi:dihydropyrimidine dehydrogenase (NADP+)/dihydropyrimidine dehydrogenase (NAD+) subunit PreA
MPTLETTVNGLRLPNPFVIGSGPPGTNANVIGKAFDEGWGAVVCKTVSLDASKVINVAARGPPGKDERAEEIEGGGDNPQLSPPPVQHRGGGLRPGQ